MLYKRIVRKVISILEHTIKEEKAYVYDETDLSGDDLKKQLLELPLKNNTVIFMHSGFKSLGKLNGGPEMVVKAMIDSLVKEKRITIAMPSFTISSSMANHLRTAKPFDVRTTMTVFKAIPTAFQNLEGVKRSIHPTHSVTAYGPKAEWLVQNHHTCGSNFGKGSPFGKLLECDAYIVGLGTRLGNVTFYHTVEDIEPDFPRRVYTEDSPINVNCIGHSGEKIHLKIYAHDPTAFKTRIDHKNGACIREIYTSLLEKRAGLTWGKIGKAATWMCDASRMYQAVKDVSYKGLSIYCTEEEIADYVINNTYGKNDA